MGGSWGPTLAAWHITALAPAAGWLLGCQSTILAWCCPTVRVGLAQGRRGWRR